VEPCWCRGSPGGPLSPLGGAFAWLRGGSGATERVAGGVAAGAVALVLDAAAATQRLSLSPPRAPPAHAPAAPLSQRVGDVMRGVEEASPPPPPSRTKWTRHVHPSVLTGHVSSLSPIAYGKRPAPPAWGCAAHAPRPQRRPPAPAPLAATDAPRVCRSDRKSM
jgi:hypothetical protein